jgi:hypothetical protein
MRKRAVRWNDVSRAGPHGRVLRSPSRIVINKIPYWREQRQIPDRVAIKRRVVELLERASTERRALIDCAKAATAVQRLAA